ncbi:hypothetical protein [Priestia flexa]|uniref:hypothetical protein n=1 Tax=Priestia flexa TaxID=86664 RepID=UPI001B333142|nr:hypothetical protein [Priestia flexa]
MKVRSLQDHDVKELIPLMEQLGYPTNFEDLQVRLSAIQASSDYHTLIAEIVLVYTLNVRIWFRFLLM